MVYVSPAAVGGPPREVDLSFVRRLLLADTWARYATHRRQREPLVATGVEAFGQAATDRAAAEERSGFDVAASGMAGVKELCEQLQITPTPSLHSTADPVSCGFTQWIFLRLLEGGLLERVERDRSVCEQCQRTFPIGRYTRCPFDQGAFVDDQVTRWYLNPGPFAERLLNDVDKGKWSRSNRREQREMLDRRRGVELIFSISRPFEQEYFEVEVFTTNIEAIHGATFLLFDPFHPLADSIVDAAYLDEVNRYRERVKHGTERRGSAVRTGGFALNPATLQHIPILLSPLANEPFGDGVVMGVPAHDRELFALARSMRLPIREVIHGNGAKFDDKSRLVEPWLGDGVLTNSGPLTSLSRKVGRDRIISTLSRRGICRRVTRHRYRRHAISGPYGWGAPVPVLHCGICGPVGVRDDELPYAFASAATKSDQAPSDASLRCPECGGRADADPHTILPWLGHSWHFLRSILPRLEVAASVPEVDASQATAVSEPAVVEPAEAAEEAASSLSSTPSPTPATPSSSIASRHAAVDSDAPADEPVATGTPPPSAPSIKTASGDAAEEEVVSGDQSRGGAEVRVPAHAESSPAVSSDAGVPTQPVPESQNATSELPEELDAPERPDASSEARETGAAAKVSSEAVGTEGESSDEDQAEPSVVAAPQTAAAPAGDGRPQSSPAERLAPPRPRKGFRQRRTFSGPQLPLPVDAAFGAPDECVKEVLGYRFVTKFLYDLGECPVYEPFSRFCSVATAKWGDDGDNAAAARCVDRGKVDEWISRYGLDALRLSVLFAGAVDSPIEFDARRVRQMRRLCERIRRQVKERHEKGKFVSGRILRRKHLLIHALTERLEAWKFHTAIAALLRFVRLLGSPEVTIEEMDSASLRTFVILLSPFAPQLAQELWGILGQEGEVASQPWPVAIDEHVHPPEREFAILVNGKVRDRMEQPATLKAEKIESNALQREAIRELVGPRKISKVVVVPHRLVSIVLEAEPKADDDA